MSDILNNVMDNVVFAECFDAVLLISGFCLGWFAWSAFHRVLMQRRWRHKVADAEADAPESRTGIAAPGPGSLEDEARVGDAQNVRWLLESYGAFGAPPGTWLSAAGEELDSASETSVEEEDGIESDVVGPAARASGRAVPAAAGAEGDLGRLFEHYALFRSDLGTWCPAREGSDEASEESTEDIAEGGDDAAQALFEQYSLFGAEPGTWCKDSDCSTVYSSESELAAAMEDVTSDVDSDAEAADDCSEALFVRLEEMHSEALFEDHWMKTLKGLAASPCDDAAKALDGLVDLFEQ